MSDTEEVLTTIQVIPDGNVQSTKGNFVVDAESGRLIGAAFKLRNVDIPIDYEHQTLGGEYSSPDGKAPAAGWIKKLWYEAGRGILALVEWTAKARELIKAKEYRYLSPVLVHRKADGKVIRLHNAALTNTPAITGIKAIAAKSDLADELNGATDMDKTFLLGPKGKGLRAIIAQEGEDLPGDMAADQEAITRLIGVLNAKGAELADDALQSEVIQAAADMLESLSAEANDGDAGEAAEANKALTALKECVKLGKEANTAQLVAAVSGLSIIAKDHEALKTEVAALKQAGVDKDFDLELNALIEAGRVLPDDKELQTELKNIYNADRDQFGVVAKALSVVCPPGQEYHDLGQGHHDPGQLDEKRGKTIAQAAKDFAGDSHAQGGSLRIYVDSDLGEAGLKALTDNEFKKLETAAE